MNEPIIKRYESQKVTRQFMQGNYLQTYLDCIVEDADGKRWSVVMHTTKQHKTTADGFIITVFYQVEHINWKELS